MTVVIAKPSEQQMRQELRALRAAGKRVNATPGSARAFLRKHGFLTKDGKLHPQYR
jgi:hypothetical protein